MGEPDEWERKWSEWVAQKDLRPRVVSLVDAAVAAGHVGVGGWYPPSEGQWAWLVSCGWWGVERAGSYLGHYDAFMQHPRWGELEDATGYETEELAQEALAGLLAESTK